MWGRPLVQGYVGAVLHQADARRYVLRGEGPRCDGTGPHCICELCVRVSSGSGKWSRGRRARTGWQCLCIAVVCIGL
jgi:hypothetical protein